MLIQVTSSDCETCCQYEKVIDKLINEQLRNETSLLSEKKIKVARINAADNHWFLEGHKEIQSVPNWVFYVDGNPYFIKNNHIYGRLLNSIKKITEPIETISSLASFERFMEFSKYDVSGRLLVRNKIVGLFSEPDDYEEYINDLKRTALQTYFKEDTLYAVCSKPIIVKEIYAKYGSKYFTNPYDKNTILYLKPKNRFAKKDELRIMDFSGRDTNLNNWLSKGSISPLEEMTSLNQMSFSTNAPLVVAFINPRKETESQTFLDGLMQLGTKYLNKANFVWVDYRDNLPLMKKLGLEGSR